MHRVADARPTRTRPTHRKPSRKVRNAILLADLELAMPLPSIKLNTSACDYYQSSRCSCSGFDGARWVRIGELINRLINRCVLCRSSHRSSNVGDLSVHVHRISCCRCGSGDQALLAASDCEDAGGPAPSGCRTCGLRGRPRSLCKSVSCSFTKRRSRQLCFRAAWRPRAWFRRKRDAKRCGVTLWLRWDT